MSAAGAPPSVHVPILTDVVDWTVTAAQAPASSPNPTVSDQPQTGSAAPLAPADVSAAHVMPTPDELADRVLSELQRQVDLMLDYRLRESLTPVLSRVADALVREARAELASTLRDLVVRAVNQELSRHRGAGSSGA